MDTSVLFLLPRSFPQVLNEISASRRVGESENRSKARSRFSRNHNEAAWSKPQSIFCCHRYLNIKASRSVWVTIILESPLAYRRAEITGLNRVSEAYIHTHESKICQRKREYSMNDGNRLTSRNFVSSLIAATKTAIPSKMG